MEAKERDEESFFGRSVSSYLESESTMISMMGLPGQTKPVTIVISTSQTVSEETTELDYLKDARRLNRILYTYLPSGTYDRLLNELFRSHMRQHLNQRALNELEEAEE